MPPLTDQDKLLKNFDITIIQHGPQPGWPVGKDIYLQCPRCQYYVSTSDYDECPCGCISIDVGYARISVDGEPESRVAVCRVRPKNKPS